MALLESRNERVKLLKKGITGTQIETMYVILNSLDVVTVDWQDNEIIKDPSKKGQTHRDRSEIS